MGHLNSQLAHRTARPFEAAHKAKGAVDESGLPRLAASFGHSGTPADQATLRTPTLSGGNDPPPRKSVAPVTAQAPHDEGCRNPPIRFTPMEEGTRPSHPVGRGTIARTYPGSPPSDLPCTPHNQLFCSGKLAQPANPGIFGDLFRTAVTSLGGNGPYQILPGVRHLLRASLALAK